MAERSAFSGGDQQYLRDVQYGDGTNLNVRTALHQRFSLSPVAFPDFEAGLVEWRPDLVVLECGTGTGRFWDNQVAPKSVTATLTDLSPAMVSDAVARATAAGFENVTGQECDVQSLPFAEDSFDLAIANHMLYHVPDPDLALAELARVLSPDGVLVAATNGYGHMREMNETVAEVFGSNSESLYEVFGIDTGEARLREQFTTIAWHAYDNDLLVTDPAHAVDYGLSYPPGESATPEQAKEFAAAMNRRFGDGQLHIRTRTGAFVARGLRQRTH